MASEQLAEMVNRYLLQEGKGAVERLAASAQVSASTIRNAAKGRCPLGPAVYRIALACGAKDKDAQLLAGRASAEAKTA